MEIESPRLLAPDLPSTLVLGTAPFSADALPKTRNLAVGRSAYDGKGLQARDLNYAHSDYGASSESRIVIDRHYLPVPGVGNLRACCLPWMW